MSIIKNFANSLASNLGLEEGEKKEVEKEPTLEEMHNMMRSQEFNLKAHFDYFDENADRWICYLWISDDGHSQIVARGCSDHNAMRQCIERFNEWKLTSS